MYAAEVRASERAIGDELFSPFVSPGWSGQAERNLRPAQWLGLLKLMAAWGAEWFYTGFFSLRAPFQPSENWCWQAMMPIYAQAVGVSQSVQLVESHRLHRAVRTANANRLCRGGAGDHIAPQSPSPMQLLVLP